MSDDMLAAITKACERPLPPSDEGYGIRELAEHWGCGEQEARKRVNAAMKAGKLLIGKRYRIDAAGRIVADRVYRAA